MAARNSLTIRLSESVVFLRTSDRLGRRHLVHEDSPPSLVRGLLTLVLAKPIRISTIDIELQATASVSWVQGIGARRFDVTESHKILSASTVFFSADSAHATRRTASVGPGIHNDDALEWEDHNNSTPVAHPPRGRSADPSIVHRDYIFRHEETPSYRTQASSASPNPNSEPNPSTSSYEEESHILTTSTDSDSVTNIQPILPPASLPPTSSSSRQSSRMSRGRTSIDDVLLEIQSGRFSRSHSRIPNSSYDPRSFSSNLASRRDSTSPSPSPSPCRKAANRFSFSGLLGAVIGERVGSSTSRLDPSTSDDTTRGRSTHKRQDSPIVESPSSLNKERPTFRKFGLGDLLGLDGDEHKTSGDGWKEFKKGTYTYPISFTIQGDSPPTLQCDYGSLVWRLKAHVHRPGTFRSKLTAVRDVTVISYPVQDDIEGHDHLVVERLWENQMQYMISISARMLHIGGVVPVQFAIMPITKIKIYRLLVFLEERVDYYVQMKHIGRTDPIRRIELLLLKNTGKDDTRRGGGPILPLESDDVEAFKNSPLYALCSPDSDPSEMAANLMGPGPWRFHQDLKLPNSCSELRFTNKNKKSNISVSHTLKVLMRVERGDDKEMDAKTGERKLFDIIVQTPVHILSCRCNPEWTSLPGYSESFKETLETCENCPCTTRNKTTTTKTTRHIINPINIPKIEKVSVPGTSLSSAPAPLPPSPPPPPSLSSPPSPPPLSSPPLPPSTSRPTLMTTTTRRPSQTQIDSLFRRNELFERLVSGRVSEIGEAPPAYASFAESARAMVQ